MSSVSWQTLITTRTNFITRLGTRPRCCALWKFILFFTASPGLTWQIRWVALSTWQLVKIASLILNTSKIMASSTTYYISCRDYKLLIKRPKTPRPLRFCVYPQMRPRFLICLNISKQAVNFFSLLYIVFFFSLLLQTDCVASNQPLIFYQLSLKIFVISLFYGYSPVVFETHKNLNFFTKQIVSLKLNLFYWCLIDLLINSLQFDT